MSTSNARSSNEPRAQSNQRSPAIFLPGIIMPASLRYAPLLEALGDTVNAVTKELEVYVTDQPPDGYSIAMEVEGIIRAADDQGFERFHLYGHSGGGACALAFAATYPERLLSLALDEPATDFSAESKAAVRQEMQEIRQLPPEEQMGAFVTSQLGPGVEPPPRPSGPAPEWMAKRPAGVEAFTDAFEGFDITPDQLRRFGRPVYYSYGSLSSPRWEAMRERLESLLPDFTSERYDGLHHFNTSHAAEPERVAEALRKLWQRAETARGEGVPV